MRYSERTRNLEGSATLQFTAKAGAMKARGEDVVSLTAGQPDFPTPTAAIKAAERAMAQGKTVYTPSAGIPELRASVAERWGRRHGIGWQAENVVVSCGAKHSIANMLEAAVNPGDRILLPKPYWVSYPQMVLRLGGVPVYPESGAMLITGDDVRRAAAEGAVGMIFNSPCNPSGLVNDRKSVEDIARAVKDTGIWVISDDIYEDLYYGEGAVPHILAVDPDLAPQVAVITGVSKTYAMTGWRIGFSLANTEWTGIASRIQAHTTSNPCSVSQYASLAVVNGEAEEEREMMFQAFSRRRDLICRLLAEVRGIEFIRPEGAFYVYPRVLTSGTFDSGAFCLELLEKGGLGTIPGSAFGTEGYIRLSFAASDDDIAEAVKRLNSFLEQGDFR
ncbi:MAG TPA: pyridoxal phosphate-dependent aminotransferase [Candidatus Sabulitectum sp.]|nr:pyridoxal phosphate-dependent aminotransferase [Candidatus Sabulitectum sp.]HPF32156.1 pyridoxal phosphate-dependent aminotransferase [Candidatus Sabulitectum sp.]HPJ28481.1 pyridoxal phosphate-dependent aminotransferase [Candidatus Sabulitectum sp.]HPR22474.1 pyridoxal phosphate-dependent aminotransferase [Candidatus Sabulitectum sp.]